MRAPGQGQRPSDAGSTAWDFNGPCRRTGRGTSYPDFVNWGPGVLLGHSACAGLNLKQANNFGTHTPPLTSGVAEN